MRPVKTKLCKWQSSRPTDAVRPWERLFAQWTPSREAGLGAKVQLHEPPRRANLEPMLSTIRRLLRLAFLLALVLIAAGAAAADTPAAAAPSAMPADRLGRETPFGTVAGFNAAMNAGNDAACRRLSGGLAVRAAEEGRRPPPQDGAGPRRDAQAGQIEPATRGTPGRRLVRGSGTDRDGQAGRRRRPGHHPAPGPATRRGTDLALFNRDPESRSRGSGATRTAAGRADMAGMGPAAANSCPCRSSCG